MSYYGNDTGGVALAAQVFTGAGSASFTLSPRIAVAEVFVNKVLQINNYTIVGNTLTFDAVVATGAEVVVEPRNSMGRQDITNYKFPTVDQSGSSTTAYTATYTPANASLIHNTILGIKILYTNSTSTPTFSPDGLTAKGIVASDGTALFAGQLAAGNGVLVRYDSAIDKWMIVSNGATGLGVVARKVLTGTTPTLTLSDLNTNASFSWSLTGNSTLTTPSSSNITASGQWYIDITVDTTGGYTLTIAGGSGVTTNPVYGYYFDCLPNAVYRLWLVSRNATTVDYSMERLV